MLLARTSMRWCLRCGPRGNATCSGQVGPADHDGDRGSPTPPGTSPPVRPSSLRRRPRRRGSRALSRLDLGRRVEHALALELVESVGVEPAVPRAGRHDHRAPDDLRPVGQTDDECPRLLPQSSRRARGADAAPNFSGLHHRPLREVGAGDARRKAEVVLDPRAVPGLATGRHRSPRRASQALRRAVHRGRQPGRTAADDDRSKHRPGRLPTVRPRYSASSPGVGRRSTEPVTITTGSSPGRRRTRAGGVRRPRRARGRATRAGCGCAAGTRAPVRSPARTGSRRRGSPPPRPS